jgi:hypothetical protein
LPAWFPIASIECFKGFDAVGTYVIGQHLASFVIPRDRAASVPAWLLGIATREPV